MPKSSHLDKPIKLIHPALLHPSQQRFLLKPERDHFNPVVAVLALALVISIGTLGYIVIEEWNILDSLYMTVITLATIGYQEVHPLSDTGRIFTIVLIIVGVGIVAIVFGTIAEHLVSRQFFRLYGQQRMNERIAKLDVHTIICGFGRVARTAAEALRSAGRAIVVIERDPLKAQEAAALGYLVAVGDASTEETLRQVRVERATALLSLLPKDADNLYVILTSREMSSNLFIVSRCEEEIGEKRLLRAGANRIMSPYRVGGLKIAEALLRPNVTDFLDLAIAQGGKHLQIEEIRIPEHSPLIGRSLQAAQLRQRTNVIVAAIISQGGEMSFNPDGQTAIEGGSTFIALGLRDELAELERILLAA